MEIHPTQTTLGMSQDHEHKFQEKGTYRFALNAVNAGRKGDHGTLVNEEGNEVCFELGERFSIVGHTIANNGDKYFAITDNATSIIAKVDKNCNYEVVIKSSCLGFQKCHMVDMEFREIDGCDRGLYLADNVNPDKAINLDELLQYVDETAILPLSPTLTKVELANLRDGWDCSLMNITPDCQVPCVAYERTNNTGGQLEYGVYQVTLQYLDADLNPTSFFPLSPEVPIFEDSTSAAYDEISGGVNNDRPATSKSITWSVNNLDTRFTYVNIIIAQTIDGITSAYRIDRVAIPGNSLTFTYTGNLSTAVQVDLADITARQPVYTTSKGLIQKDNRLLRFGVKETYRDWFKFQRRAMNIQTKYVSSDVQADHPTFGHKQGSYYFYTRGYQANEVYSFGIVFVFNDKSESPVFHIPGRRKNEDPYGTYLMSTGEYNPGHTRPPAFTGWDSSTMADMSVNADEYAFAGGSSDLERWQIFNTAIKDSYPETGYHSSGYMSYHEVMDEVYPDVEDCNGDPLYGEDTGEKVRHHRFPDRTLEPHFEFDAQGRPRTYSLGIKFDNIVIPPEYADEVQGFYIVRQKRDDSNRTVVDNGTLHHDIIAEDSTPEDYYSDFTDGKIRYQSYPFNGVGDDSCNTRRYSPAYEYRGAGIIAADDSNGVTRGFTLRQVSLHTPKLKFQQPVISNTTHLKLEYRMSGTAFKHSFLPGNPCPSDDGYRLWAQCNYDTVVSAVPFTNTSMDAIGYVNYNSVLNNFFTHDYVNTTQQETVGIDLSRDLLHAAYGTPNENDIWLDGNDNIDSFVYYVSLMRYNPTAYEGLENATYYQVSDCIRTGTSTIEYGGDTFISKMWQRKDMNLFTPNTRYGTIRAEMSSWIESEINTGLRHQGTVLTDDDGNNICQSYYPEVGGSVNDWLDTANDSLLIDSGEQSIACENYYAYNNDYSKTRIENAYFPLDPFSDYCRDCIACYPYRIIYSQAAFSEQRTDNYRSFLGNNFTDIPHEKGPITNLFILNDNLYIHSPRTLWMQPTKAQTINTNENVAFIGTGDFMSIEAREMISTAYGYGGSTSQWATAVTEYGALYPDLSSGKVFQLSGQLSEISDEGMRTFFEENLPSKLACEYEELFGEEYPCLDAPANLHSGIGMLSTYDPRYKRWILSKKDYKLTEEARRLIGLQRLIFTRGRWRKVVPGTKIDVEVSLTDTTYFENCSWTISYSFLSRKWISFHSYLPTYLLNDQENFFSAIGSGLWKHDKRNFQTFYDTKYDHIIDFLINPDAVSTRKFDSLTYIGQTERYIPDRNSWIDVNNTTFDRLVAYNDHQCTGLLELVVKPPAQIAPVAYTNTSIPIVRHDRNWSVNRLRNLVTSTTEPIFSEAWLDIQGDYYIDKVVNNAALDLNLSQYDQERLRDKYVGFRLYFNPRLDYQITTDVLATLDRQSVR